MFDITVDDVFAVYGQLKDRYELVLTNTVALNEGFTVDCPIIVGKAHNKHGLDIRTILESIVCLERKEK